MKHFIYLVLHAVTLLFSCLKPGGIKALAAENLVLKQQLIVIRRSRARAPRLTTADRLIFGWLSMLMNPGRILKSAIIIAPPTEFGKSPTNRSNSLNHFPWKSHCNGLFQTPLTA